MEETLKALSPVLVRNYDYETWKPDLIRDRVRGADEEFICCSGVYRQCVPFNRDLNGTTYSPEEVAKHEIKLEFGDRIKSILDEKEYRFIRKHDNELLCYDEKEDRLVFVRHYSKIDEIASVVNS